ncbi:MAG: hypothetical protein ACOYMR_08750 [Ilumatobacteraceae bacterium]
MKRILAIVAVVLSVGVVVGAFIIGGGDGSTEAKGSTSTTIKSNDVKSGAEAISNAGSKVASLSPAPAKSDDKDKDKDDKGKKCGSEVNDDGKYEAKKAFVGVSPSTARAGREVELKIRNFPPCSQVTITISNGTTSVNVPVLSTDKKGRAEKEFKAPAASTVDYVVTAVGTGSTSATTSLKVVNKK